MKSSRKNSLTLHIEPLIHLVRGQKVIIDTDLSLVYGVQTKRLNEQVKRNSERFPEDFVFRMTFQEVASLRAELSNTGIGLNRSQFATGSHKHRDPRQLPYAFTEYGAIMAANVLNSARAIRMSVLVVRAFVRMRDVLATTESMGRRLAEIEKKLLANDVALRDLYRKIRPLLLPPPEKPKRRIGFGVGERRLRYKKGVRRGG